MADHPGTLEARPKFFATAVDHYDEIPVLRVSGEIDLATGPQLAAALDAMLPGEPRPFVIDLAAVRFLGSVGLSLLVTRYRGAARSGVAMALAARTPVVLRSLRITGLDALLTILPTAAEAVEHVRSRPTT